MARIYVGHDWAEDHHDIYIENKKGRRLDYRRVDDGVAGVAAVHAMIAAHAEDPSTVLVATETDRGLFVTALITAGYQVIALNPMQTARYRERESTSGAKSDEGDARTLAGVARLDGHRHRLLEPDTALADTIKHTARAHQNLVWTRQRQLNQLRSVLREFYPAAIATVSELTHRDALAALATAPTPTHAGRVQTRSIEAALRRAGRQRSINRRATEIRHGLPAEHLRADPTLEASMGSHVTALTAIATEMTAQIDRLEAELDCLLDTHPDATIIRSIPGVSTKLGARLLGEFGDAPDRFADLRARRNYAGTSPGTKASGKSHVVLARRTRNVRLSDACYLWAFTSISHSEGARTFYDQRRQRGDSHSRALRALANRLVGILHGCLTHQTLYDEHTAWGHRVALTA